MHVPEVNDEPLPTPAIDPRDLIALARWHHFDESPPQVLIDRLVQREIAAPVTSGWGSDVSIVGVAILDEVIEAQVEEVPDLHAWWHAVSMNRQPRMSEQPYSFTKLVSDRVRLGAQWHRRFVVLTGTTPAAGASFTLNQELDARVWPWDPFRI